MQVIFLTIIVDKVGRNEPTGISLCCLNDISIKWLIFELHDLAIMGYTNICLENRSHLV